MYAGHQKGKSTSFSEYPFNARRVDPQAKAVAIRHGKSFFFWQDCRYFFLRSYSWLQFLSKFRRLTKMDILKT